MLGCDPQWTDRTCPEHGRRRRDCFPIVLTLVIVDEAAQVLSAGEKRIDCNCFGEVSNRRVEFTQLAIDVAAVEKGDSILRVAPYELGAVWDRIQLHK